MAVPKQRQSIYVAAKTESSLCIYCLFESKLLYATSGLSTVASNIICMQQMQYQETLTLEGCILSDLDPYEQNNSREGAK